MPKRVVAHRRHCAASFEALACRRHRRRCSIANLGVYENARRALTPQDVEPAPLWTHAAAGAIGGLTITFVTTPLSRIKVQQQLSGASAVATVQSIGSWRSLYAGFSMSSLFEASRGLYMFSYCVIKRRLEVYCDANSDGVLPLWARTVAGASANVVTWGVMYPVESIRTSSRPRRRPARRR